MPSPIFVAKPETLALVELLAATPPGALLSFQRLSAAAGLADIRQQEHLLQSALKIAEREHKVVYRNERTRGYRRLTTEELSTVETRAANHQRSVARQTITTLTRGVERANDIPKETQLRLNIALARQGIIARIAAPGMAKANTEPGAPLPSAPEIAQRMLDRARQRPLPKRRSG